MILEKGEYYKTRDGRMIGPAQESFGEWEFEGDWSCIHNSDGTYAGEDEPGLDIVAKWTGSDRKALDIISEIEELMIELRSVTL